jgi:(1->4)-alpha-D-glucan 1-alpha-D-glucosylmutase
MAEYGSVFVTHRPEGPAPSLRDQYIMLQTIVGTWPFGLDIHDESAMGDYRERILAYTRKAAREAKLETSWTNPDHAYEEALERYGDALLNPGRSSTLVRIVREFAQSVMAAGALTSLSQKLLTLTVPGVPDVYQGTDGWDLSLVDPDNRRPVDFGLRRRWAAGELRNLPRIDRVLTDWHSGEVKHLMVRSVLTFRSQYPDLFATGEYLSLETQGSQAERIVAFARRRESQVAIVVVPRLVSRLLEEQSGILPAPSQWDDTAVLVPDSPNSQFSDMITGLPLNTDDQGRLPVAKLFARFPVSVLWNGDVR